MCETRPHPFSSWRETIFSSVTVSPWFDIHSVQHRINSFNILIFDTLIQISVIFHMQTYQCYFFFNKCPFHMHGHVSISSALPPPYYASVPYPSEFTHVFLSPSKCWLCFLDYIWWKFFTSTLSCFYCAMYFYTNQEWFVIVPLFVKYQPVLFPYS